MFSCRNQRGIDAMKALTGLLATLLAAAIICAGPAVWWFDRRPATAAALHLHVLFWRLDWPGLSLKARLDRQAADLRQAVANERTLTAAIRAQNASLAGWSARGRRATAQAENAVQRGRAPAAVAEKARAAIAAPLPASDTVCQKAEEVDRRFMETLR